MHFHYDLMMCSPDRTVPELCDGRNAEQYTYLRVLSCPAIKIGQSANEWVGISSLDEGTVSSSPFLLCVEMRATVPLLLLLPEQLTMQSNLQVNSLGTILASPESVVRPVEVYHFW